MNKKGFHEIAPYDHVSEKPFDFSAWTHRSGAAPSHHSTMPTDPTSKITGEAVASAYLTMRRVDNRIRERTPSQCLIPRDDGNGRAVVDCARDTQRSHTVQEAVLRMIASGKTPSVITFVPIDSQILANASKGEDGSLWSTLPWDLPSLPLKLEPIQTASTRHFSCNRCDSTTFRQIEHTPIEWPKWPQVLVINELETDGHDPLFSHQMFLLAYRCLIKEICFARGSMTSTLHRLENEEMDPRERTRTEELYRYQKTLVEQHLRHKTKYDRRLTGIASLPMIHHIVPVNPAFPIVSVSAPGLDAPKCLKFASVTVYPERRATDQSADELQHWMVVSTEAQYAWSMQSWLDIATRHALDSFTSPELSTGWTVLHIQNSGFESVFGQPDGYMDFKEREPEAAQAIERMMIDHIRGTRQRGWLDP